MAKLLMITGLGSAKDLAFGKKGAFYNTLEEFHKYWERIDIISPKIENSKQQIVNSKSNYQLPITIFNNVYIHISPWPLVFHPLWFLKKGLEIYKEQKFDLMTAQDFPPFYNGIGARLLWRKINPHTHFRQLLKNIFLPWQKSKVSVGVKVPYVLEFHHIPGYPKAANLKEKVYANQFIWMLYWKIFGSKSKAVRVVNQKQAPEFLKKAGVPKEKIVYIPSMYIDLDIFKPMTNDQGLMTKEYDLIFVGRLAENKGIVLFLEAVKSLVLSHKLSVKCLIVGDGPLKKSLKFKVKSLKLEENVILYGWAKDQHEIAELLNKSKILIMPSYNEGGPRVVLEAMACGVPVLATSVGLIPDLKDKKAVKIVDWDAEDIAHKAKELLEDDGEGKRLSPFGLEVARQFEKKEAIKNYAEKLKSFVIK